MTAPRRRPVVNSIGAALLAAGASAVFLMLAVATHPAMPQPLLLAAAATTGVCAWRCAR